jgi:hypothetical protein
MKTEEQPYIFLRLLQKIQSTNQRFCERFTEKGKSGKQVICAAIRKLLHIIFWGFKSGKPFDPNYKNLSFST